MQRGHRHPARTEIMRDRKTAHLLDHFNDFKDAGRRSGSKIVWSPFQVRSAFRRTRYKSLAQVVDVYIVTQAGSIRSRVVCETVSLSCRFIVA